MRPDRIVVGEVRGGEALDMLMALNTGHEGSLTTVHANSPEDALRRVETLALMAGVGLPHAAVREQVASALDLVVHQARRADGSRRIESVAEVVRVAGGAGTRELYRVRAGRPFWRPPAGDSRLGRRIGGGEPPAAGPEQGSVGSPTAATAPAPPSGRSANPPAEPAKPPAEPANPAAEPAKQSPAAPTAPVQLSTEGAAAATAPADVAPP
jgi:pilus assembly protein CpaF